MLLPGAEQAVEVVPGSARVGVAQDFAQDVPEAVAVAPDPPLIGGVSGGDQNDDAMSAVAAAADAFETAADAGDAIAAADALRAITQAARTPGAARDAVPSLASRLARIAAEGSKGSKGSKGSEGSEGSEGSDSRAPPAYLPDLLRALRNACAGDRDATDAACLGVAPVPNALRRLIPVLAAESERESPEGGSNASNASDASDASNGTTNPAVTALVVATQLAANVAAGGSDAASSRLWSELWPQAVSFVARSRSGLVANGAHPPLCMMAHARCGRIIRAPSGAAGSARGSTRGDGDETAHSWGGGWSAPEPPTNIGSVCGFEAGRTVWIPLLEASCDPAMARWPGAGGGEWLHRFVARACVFSGEFAPQLCRSLGPRAEETAANRDDRLRAKILIAGGPGGSDEDEDDARRRRAAAFGDAALGDDEDHSESFSSAQATLLHLIREEVSVAPAINPDAGPDAGPESHLVLCEGTLSYLLDATSRAAGVVEAVASAKLVEESAEVNAAAARCVLEECLGIWRVVTERRVEPRIVQTPGDVVSAACAMGLPRLLLALCAAMPPPTGAGQTSKASGPAAAPRLNAERVSPAALADGHPPFPRERPWPGYRVDCIAPLANAMFARPLVCDQVAKLGGVAIVLAATRGEDGDDYLREWALWGVRNLCAGSDVARGEIERMQPQAAADSQQLAAMGLNVEVDPGTGRVRVGSTRRAAGGGDGGGPSPGAGDSRGAAGSVPGGLLLGPEGARTPAGRAAVAALMAGLDVSREAGDGEDDDDAFEAPPNWKVADLS